MARLRPALPAILLAVAALGGGAHPARAPLAAVQAEAPDGDWDAAWDALARLGELTPGSAEAVQLRDALAGRARERARTPRGWLLGALLAGTPLEPGADDTPSPLGEGSWPFDARESWLLALATPSGSELGARAVEEALGGSDEALDERRLQRAWEAGVASAEALDLERAIGIQRALHARHDEVWSATDLVLSLGRAGRFAEADALLSEALERHAGAAVAELWSRRGLLALGAGNERRGRDYLGRALGLGSADAAVLLARLDLADGRLDAARDGFRSLLLTSSSGAWARRGWGIAQLDRDPVLSPPARRP